jgi:hypothetical protein
MSLHQVKQDLAAALHTTGIKVTTYVPQGVTPPVIVMQSQDPYVEDVDDSFKRQQMLVHLLVTYVSGKIGTNAVQDIDKQIDKIVSAIPGSWTLSVGSIYAGSVNGKTYASCDISVSNLYNLID